MELLEPLKDELEQNLELARSTEALIREERDMLQGESEERIVLFTLSTDVWQSVTNAGNISNFGEYSDQVALAYRHIYEINAVIEKFNRYGDRIMYTPLMKSATDRYNREKLLDVIQEMCAEASIQIMKAQEAVEELIKTECPVCGTRFPSRKAMKSHVTQKSDPEHQAFKDRVK